MGGSCGIIRINKQGTFVTKRMEGVFLNHNLDIKAVFVDLDGTLLRGVDGITARTARAFQEIKARGILPIIATGRPACESDFAIQAIGANRYLIVMNGLEIYEDYVSRRLLHESYMTAEQSDRIIPWLLEHELFIEVYIGEQSYCQKDNHQLIWECGMTSEQSRFFADIVDIKSDLMGFIHKNGLHVNKVLISTANKERIPALRRKMEEVPGIQTLSSGPHYIEVLPKGMDKGLAVEMVCASAGWPRDQVMAIGDSENDIGMFQAAGLRVAMGNAYPELKAKADRIAPTCEEDGVAWALENLL